MTDKKRRGMEVNQARRFLGEMRRLFEACPAMGSQYNIMDSSWFTDREADLQKLLKM